MARKSLSFSKKFSRQMPCLVEFQVVIPRRLAVGRYHCDFARSLQGDRHTLIGIEALVGKHHVRFDLRQQHIRPVQIADLRQ